MEVEGEVVDLTSLIIKFKEKINGVKKKCDELVEHYTSKLIAIKTKRENLEKQLKDIREEKKTLNRELSAIGFLNLSKMFQLRIQYQKEIDDLIAIQKKKIVVSRVKQMQANRNLQEMEKVQRQSQDLLDEIHDLEKYKGKVKTTQRSKRDHNGISDTVPC